MSMPEYINLVEVGARDGLQNERITIGVDTRVKLITQLVDSGLTIIEAGAFVSPNKVPQMAHTAEVLARVPKHPNVRYPVLVPNQRGYDDAIEAGAEEIAIFIGASEAFSMANTGQSIQESLRTCQEIARIANHDGIKVRGYISCVIDCPYEGPTQPHIVAELSQQLLDSGCKQISLGDTIGTGTPGRVKYLIDACIQHAFITSYAVHFHDTYGQALANIYASLEYGIDTIDTSIAGLGGCPFAPGASGNVATEDVVYMLDGLGINTGVDLNLLVEAATSISSALGRQPVSRVSQALSGESAQHSTDTYWS